jgi:hypothetical protein
MVKRLQAIVPQQLSVLEEHSLDKQMLLTNSARHRIARHRVEPQARQHNDQHSKLMAQRQVVGDQDALPPLGRDQQVQDALALLAHDQACKNELVALLVQGQQLVPTRALHEAKNGEQHQ